MPPKDFDKTDFFDSVIDGTWKWNSWNTPSITINKQDATFVGTWDFNAKNYTADFTFANSDTLPDSVKNLLQREPNQTGINGGKISPKNATFDNVEVDDGTWKFADWDAKEKIFDKNNITFTGTWNFVPAVIEKIDNNTQKPDNYVEISFVSNFLK